jgi:hypothetical protein
MERKQTAVSQARKVRAAAVNASLMVCIGGKGKGLSGGAVQFDFNQAMATGIKVKAKGGQAAVANRKGGGFPVPPSVKGKPFCGGMRRFDMSGDVIGVIHGND